MTSRNSTRRATASGYVPGYEWNMSVCFSPPLACCVSLDGESVGDKGEGGGGGGGGDVVVEGRGGFMSKSMGLGGGLKRRKVGGGS